MAVKINFRPSLRKLSDEELMGRVRQMGDEKAFDELYRRYARRLYGFFFRMLGREGLHTGTVLARMGGKGAV